MVRSCSAFGCNNRDTKESRGRGLKFYCILVNVEKRRLWLSAINRKDFNPPSDAAICSDHFVGGVRSDEKDSPAYVPTLFSFASTPKKHQATQGLERWKTAKRRSEEASNKAELSKIFGEDLPSSLVESSATEVYPDIGKDNSVDMSEQTDTTIAELHQLESDNYSRQEEITLPKEQIGAPLGFQLKKS